ncbi:hypothetical protein [Bdellovibrio sp. HCB337]|uniref:hypothetical protein n=1 Tax=Bdellovibrio sp. HCB337 TaxID=3394358 RepID=UPI0039A509AE
MKKVFSWLNKLVHFLFLAGGFYFIFSGILYLVWLEGLNYWGWAKFDPNTAELINSKWEIRVPAIVLSMLLAWFLQSKIKKPWALGFLVFSFLFSLLLSLGAIGPRKFLYRVPERLIILDKIYGKRIDGCAIFKVGMHRDEFNIVLKQSGHLLGGDDPIANVDNRFYSISWTPDPPIEPSVGLDNVYRSVYFDRKSERIVEIHCFDGTWLKNKDAEPLTAQEYR